MPASSVAQRGGVGGHGDVAVEPSDAQANGRVAGSEPVGVEEPEDGAQRGGGVGEGVALQAAGVEVLAVENRRARPFVPSRRDRCLPVPARQAAPSLPRSARVAAFALA
jgi:hypothetical protein